MDIIDKVLEVLNHIHIQCEKRKEAKNNIIASVLQVLDIINDIESLLNSADCKARNQFINSKWQLLNSRLDDISKNIYSKPTSSLYKKLNPYLQQLSNVRRECTNSIIGKKSDDEDGNLQLYIEEHPNLDIKYNLQYEAKMKEYLIAYKNALQNILHKLHHGK